MPLAGLVLNRVQEVRAPELSAEAATTAAHQLADADPRTSALLRLHADRLRNAERQARLARRFTVAHPAVPVTEVYALAEDVHDLEGLREVGALMASPTSRP